MYISSKQIVYTTSTSLIARGFNLTAKLFFLEKKTIIK